MAIILRQVEAIPAAYPDAPSGLSTGAAALDPDMLWQRIEGWVAHRWTARAVVCTVEGPGEWLPPLTPATITTIEIWDSSEVWITLTLSASPLGGYDLPSDCLYRFTGTAGDSTPPAAVLEAFKRLAEYSADITASDLLKGRPGVSEHSASFGTVLEHSFNRNPAWGAKALAWSGAADLLRPYRRA